MRATLILGEKSSVVNLGNTLLLSKLGVRGSNAVQAVVEDAILRLRLNNSNGRAALNSSEGAHRTGIATAHDNDVGLDGLRTL